ncbi:MAG: 5'-nucleotidase [Armatimonadetes bacterium]|nr:5'-nucleotidase [Armatimonadota bacterium]
MILVIALVAVVAGACLAQAATTQSASPLGNKDIGKNETAIGSLVADAVRACAKTDVALIAASELKSKDPPIAAGKVDSSELTSLISYADDPLAVLELTGKQIRQALEKAVSIYPQPNLGFLQVSGLKFTFTPTKSAGERVASVTVNGSPLDDSHTYTVAVTNSMASGALGYFKIWSTGNLRRKLDSTIAKTVDSYIAANPSINYASLDRIAAK